VPNYSAIRKPKSFRNVTLGRGFKEGFQSHGHTAPERNCGPRSDGERAGSANPEGKRTAWSEQTCAASSQQPL